MNVTSTIQGIDSACMPWFFNMSDKPKGQFSRKDTSLWIQYDHLTCYMIELAYQKYKAGDKTHQ